MKTSKVHSTEKTFVCNDCGKSIKRAGTLKEHKQVHKGVKALTGNDSGKTFSQTSDLKEH